MVEAAGIEPASASFRQQGLHAYSAIGLILSYPAVRENLRPALCYFSNQTQGASSNDLVFATPGAESTSTTQAEGITLVFKQLMRSCCFLQLKFTVHFTS
jgi:hypothetical protein